MSDTQFHTVDKEQLRRTNAAKIAGATMAGGAILALSQPASAQTSPAADITSAVNSLSGIAGAALVVVIGVMVSAMGVSYAKRVGSKG